MVDCRVVSNGTELDREKGKGEENRGGRRQRCKMRGERRGLVAPTEGEMLVRREEDEERVFASFYTATLRVRSQRALLARREGAINMQSSGGIGWKD